MMQAARPDWITVAQAVVCYLGVVLYGGVLSVTGRRPGLSAFIVIFYAGLFPIPTDTPAFLIQEVLLGLAFASFGAHVLGLHVQSLREVRAMEAGRPSSPTPLALALLLQVPALAVVASFTAATVSGLLAGEPAHALARPVLHRAAHVAVMLVVAAYMTAAWAVGRTWLPKVAHVRLLVPAVWLNWLNLLFAIATAILAAAFAVTGLESPSARLGTVAALWLGLLPVAIELRSIADAVARRVVTLHAMIAIVAAVVFGVPMALRAVGLGPEITWASTLSLLALSAMALPARIDEAVAAWLFPRAALMRARLAEIATEPLAAATRSEAAARLLRRVVEALDGEGGILVLAPAAGESASTSTCGRADAAALGATAEEALAWLAPLVRSGPRRVDVMPLAERLRLLRAETLLACPLHAGRPEGVLEGVLLLGERRGWPYDAGTVQALGTFGSEAGLALANLTLAADRLRSDKLAALGAAAARIAHEIRNPLAGARSLVQQAAAMDGAAPLVQPALDELDRIGRLVRDLLVFARVDDRRTSDPVDLEEVCRRACMQLAGVAAASDVTVTMELAATPVIGDRDRLVQVIANLARNGIEAAAGSAARRVTVRTCCEGAIATVEVRDTGPGIAADDVPRLFEPFRTSKPEGTGLGLTIARRIVESHGGRLAVTGGGGAETVFRVELPLDATALRSAPRASRAPA